MCEESSRLGSNQIRGGGAGPGVTNSISRQGLSLKRPKTQRATRLSVSYWAALSRSPTPPSNPVPLRRLAQQTRSPRQQRQQQQQQQQHQQQQNKKKGGDSTVLQQRYSMLKAVIDAFE